MADEVSKRRRRYREYMRYYNSYKFEVVRRSSRRFGCRKFDFIFNRGNNRSDLEFDVSEVFSCDVDLFVFVCD